MIYYMNTKYLNFKNILIIIIIIIALWAVLDDMLLKLVGRILK